MQDVKYNFSPNRSRYLFINYSDKKKEPKDNTQEQLNKRKYK